jgi:tetratricopeptide (TPR) repeat protein
MYKTAKNNTSEYYYDAMDLLNTGKAVGAIKLLEKAIKLDSHNVEILVGLSWCYFAKRNREKYEKFVKKAFEETKKKFPKWPEDMLWGFLKNRQYLRAIKEMACIYWEADNQKEAEKLFRLLLKLNPNDNQGIRYLIAGMFAGITGREVDKMIDKRNKKQDWSEIENLLSEQNMKHNFWKEPKDE